MPTILPHELPSALDGRSDIKLLSLDCFDTLLWRDTHAPRDIFEMLAPVTPRQRIWAEHRARRAAMVRRKRHEVTIAEIAEALYPNGDAATRAAFVEAEIAAEARHCFAFAPTVALIRAAKARGIRTVIVSDTYLTAVQLETLVRRAAGDAVADLIDRFFVSCEHGMSKGEGLFEPMLKAMRIPAQRILHIGDNRNADLVSAERHGLTALHLKQFGAATEQRLRLEAAAGAMIHAGGIAFQPHRATLAAGEPKITDPAEALGYGVLGPVLLPFARWIAEEAKTIGGKVHKLFLMRDGHLPRRMFEAAFPGDAGHAIELSRYTAIAASFRDEGAVRRYVETELGNSEAEDFLRQLLFDKTEIAALVRRLPEKRERRLADLAKAVLSPECLPVILHRSHAFAERLVAYIRAEADPAPGDTLMLIDLGYNGTVQNHVDALLREAFGAHVAGRYLLLREQDMTGLDKAGLIDGRHYDDSTLETFAGAVAVLEQLCTAAQGSVVDYAEGKAVRAASSIKGRQSETRESAQAGCVAFARDHGATIVRAGDAGRDEAGRIAAAASLARLMFLPQPEELIVLRQFEHDVNLGNDDTVPLFDPAVAEAGLKERGLFYLKGAERMYLPAELRGQGLPLNLTLLALNRFDLGLRYADFCDQGVEVPILIADGNEVVTSSVRATPTHDGYFLATVPVGASRFAVGLQFGRNWEWLQIASARFVPVEHFMDDARANAEGAAEALPSLEGMEQTAPYLFRCQDEHAFLMVPPNATAGDEQLMLAVAFRPLVERIPSPVAAQPHASIGAAR